MVEGLREKIRLGEIKDQGSLKQELKKSMVGILESAAVNSGSSA